MVLLHHVLTKVYKLIETDSYKTKRELYYEDVVLYKSQTTVDSILDDIACLLNVSKIHLHVLTTSKGCVAGKLRFKDADGNYIDCSESGQGVLIPSNVHDISNIQSDARFILVVEKSAVYQMLIDSGITSLLHPCILITGKGFPDVNTREILKKLADALEIPILGLVDADPYGIEILGIYKYGSKAMAFDVKNLAVPEMRWLGLLPTDIQRLNLPAESTISMTENDIKKATQVLNLPYIQHHKQWLNEETLDALRDLSTFFTENNIQNRRNLRSEIEKRSLKVNEEFLSSFKEMKESLDSLYGDVSAMNNCCIDMMSRLKATKSQTHDLINETTKLQAESQKIQMKQEVAQAFLDTFHLKQDEVKVLRGTRDGSLDENFFKALAKVKKIHNNCKVLLRSSQQTAGIEIMESMALQQEAAYERLYRWTQSECRLLNVESPELSPLLSQAMESLQDRPVLFKYSLDEYANARRAAVVRSFIDALTRGGTGGTPRPIEMHSHDSLRYVGDMLAWLHQATASEKEILEGVLKRCSLKDLENEIQIALAHITEGLCRPLKVRMEQVIVSEQAAVILFKLGSVLKFYLHTIKQVINTEAVLLTTLEEMLFLSQKMFYNSLTCHCNRILEKVEIPPADLGPLESLKQSLALLREVLSCQDACLVSVDDRQKDVPLILSAVIEPLLQMCHVSASKLASADMATYLANCIYLIHSTLMLFEYTDQQLEMLQAQIDAHLDTLVSEQASTIVGQLGLGALYTSLQDFQPKQGPLSNLPGCDALAIQAAVKKLDSFLTAPDSLTIPQSILLLSASLRQTLRKRSMELLCTAYSQIYEAINLPSNNYLEPKLLLPRTPEQVKTLLL